MKILLYIALLACSVSISDAGEVSHLDNTKMGLIWLIPFAGVLLSIAVLPAFFQRFWDNNIGKISAFWGVLVTVMILSSFGIATTNYIIVETYLLHFIPFIVFILALYVVSGGIKIDIIGQSTPLQNTFFLACATIMSSIIGTTGAAMLLIRPFISFNAKRKNKSYLIVFFIFLVCNIGGSLSAVGDPPLFIGYLKGVDFFWPTYHLSLPFLVMTLPILGIFYLIDNYNFKYKEKYNITSNVAKVSLLGKQNLLLLGIVLFFIIMSGNCSTVYGLTICNIFISYAEIFRDIALVMTAYISWKYCNKEIRKINHFSWVPFKEVFIIFAAIFITAAPVLEMLKAGNEGVLSNLFNLLNQGSANNTAYYFWLTGILSAFLDNAPTYLVFFNLAGGDANYLMTTGSKTLMAISCGAVFMGALTYIGNAPNFMIKTIAEDSNIVMPSFFAYFLRAICILLPLLIIVTLIFL